jgi:integrase
MGKRRANDEGTIYFHQPSGRWAGQAVVGRHPITGKPVRKTVYGDTQREVRERLDEVKRRPPTSPSHQTVATAIDFWLASHKARVDPKTARVYRYEVGPARERLGHLRLSDLTAMDVADLYRWMAERGDSADRQRRAGARLRQCLSKCVKMDLLQVSPAARVDLPRSRRREVTPLTAEEARRLLQAARGRPLEALYHLALDSGARVGELLALTWADVDLEAREVYFRRSVQDNQGELLVKEAKTPKSRRRVPVGRRTAEALAAHRVASPSRGPEAPVFQARGGGHFWPTNLHRAHWVPMREAAGLPKARFHDLRHTCATLLLLANVHPKVVQERLGHATIEMTLNTYSHLLPGMQTSAVAALEAALYPEEAPVTNAVGEQ